MENRPDPAPDEGTPPEIADAEALFRDAPPARPEPAQTRPPAPEDAGHYEVEDRADAARRAYAPAPPDERGTRPRPAAAAATPRLEPSAAVEQVWSRGAEWAGSV